MVVLAFTRPTLGSRGFRKLGAIFQRLARRRGLAVLTVGLAALGIRAAVLPIEPIPEPIIHDEFSTLLLGDTFALGRPANPPHPMWIHFETFHVIWHPTYASMFYPVQGLFLAAGKVVAGHPFWGVWLSVGLMCAAICWALQGWLPTGWALLGGTIAVMRLAAFSYWANSYYGGAATAIGGALVLGALPRIRRTQRTLDALLMGLGLAMLAASRPYEGIFMAIPVGVALVVWMFGKKGPTLRSSITRVVAPAALVLAVAFLGLAYYFWRVTGNPLLIPYELNARTYGVVYFPWQKPAFPAHYNHAIFDEAYRVRFYGMYQEARQHPILMTLWNVVPLWLFFLGPALTLPLLMLLPMAPRGFSLLAIDSKTRLMIMICVSVFAGMALVVYRPWPHYAAPATVALYALLLQAIRHLRLWQWRGRLVGRFMVRAVPAICFLMLLVRMATPPLGFAEPTRDPITWCSSHRGNLERARVLAELNGTPGKHLVIVRYATNHDWRWEWVYNDADIDHSKVVWAHDMASAQNRELFDYFKDRHIWLIDADDKHPIPIPYTAGNVSIPAAAESAAGSPPN